MTRQYVTVALNGDGGDESFAGYARYRGIEHLHKYMKVPRPLRQAIGLGLGLAAKIAPQVPRADMFAYANRMSLWDENRRYVQYMVYFPLHFKERLISDAMKAAIPADQWDSEQLTIQWMAAMNGAKAVDRYMSSDIAYYLPGALLPKVDRMTMANSLEGRSPFLDHPLMEFAAGLPAELKFHDRILKHVLKTAASGIFSQEFLNRPKQGFGVPLSQWFRGKLRPLLEDLLLDETARNRGLLNTDNVKLLIQQHVEGRQDHHNRLWALLMFEAWARTFLDRPNPIAGPVSFGS